MSSNQTQPAETDQSNATTPPVAPAQGALPAFLAEIGEHTPTVTVAGTAYPIKPEVPALVMVTLHQQRKMSGGELEDFALTMDLFIAFGNAIFGESAFQQLLATGYTIPEISAGISQALDFYLSTPGRGGDGDPLPSTSSTTGA